MCGVFSSKDGKDFFGKHFEAGGAGVFVFVDVDGDLWWGDLWWSGCGCGYESWVGE